AGGSQGPWAFGTGFRFLPSSIGGGLRGLGSVSTAGEGEATATFGSTGTTPFFGVGAVYSPWVPRRGKACRALIRRNSSGGPCHASPVLGPRVVLHSLLARNPPG